MKNYQLLFFFLISFGSCTNNFQVTNDHVNKFKKVYTLVENDNYFLNLDDNTPSVSLCIQYIYTDSTEMLATVNKYMNSINLFDLKTKNKIKSYQFDLEGANGIGKISGFLYHNEDSIFTYSQSTNELNIVNSKGERFKRMILFETNKRSSVAYFPSPNVVTSSPIKKIDNLLILNGYLVGESWDETFDNSPTTLMVNLETDKIDYANGYPEFYHKYNWGGGPTYRSTCYEVNDNNIIVSFPASHEIQVFSIDNNSYSHHYAGSDEIKEIFSYDSPKKRPVDSEKVFEWYMGNPSYEGIFYDKYNQVYYRIARLPVDDYTPAITYNNKPVVVIILDSDFNYIGETLLPARHRYSPYNVFINEKGMNMQIKDDGENGDDRMTFVTFKLEKI